MPRKLRTYLPNIPCHIIQRGNNRSDCFFCEENYRLYLRYLNKASEKYTVAVHAYVLMTNHVHLLMTPVDTIGISKVMQSVGVRYVKYFNKKYRRSGTLWEDRHKSSLICEEDYLFICYKYIELNPVRAGMVVHPGDYPWSSYHFNAYGRKDPLIKPHFLYEQLSKDTRERLSNYRELFSSDISEDKLHEIRKAVYFSEPLGNIGVGYTLE